jgi:hypothetical protein
MTTEATIWHGGTRMLEALKLLEAEGLTPFDLLSWTTLLDLLSGTANLMGGIDIDVRHGVRSEIEAAARRKSVALDSHPNANGFHAKVLKEFGVEL